MNTPTAALVALIREHGAISPHVLLMLAGQQKLTHRHIAKACENRALRITVCVTPAGNTLTSRVQLGINAHEHQADKEA